MGSCGAIRSTDAASYEVLPFTADLYNPTVGSGYSALMRQYTKSKEWESVLFKVEKHILVLIPSHNGA